MNGFSESQIQWAVDFVIMGKFKPKRADPLGQALRDEIEDFGLPWERYGHNDLNTPRFMRNAVWRGSFERTRLSWTLGQNRAWVEYELLCQEVHGWELGAGNGLDHLL